MQASNKTKQKQGRQNKLIQSILFKFIKYKSFYKKNNNQKSSSNHSIGHRAFGRLEQNGKKYLGNFQSPTESIWVSLGLYSHRPVRSESLRTSVGALTHTSLMVWDKTFGWLNTRILDKQGSTKKLTGEVNANQRVLDRDHQKRRRQGLLEKENQGYD